MYQNMTFQKGQLNLFLEEMSEQLKKVKNELEKNQGVQKNVKFWKRLASYR